jgi:hypothetical protein
MAKGYVDAYRAFDEPVFLNKAIKKRCHFLVHHRVSL